MLKSESAETEHAFVVTIPSVPTVKTEKSRVFAHKAHLWKIMTIGLVVVGLVGASVLFAQRLRVNSPESLPASKQTITVIQEEAVIPNTVRINGIDGRLLHESIYQVPLQTQANGKQIVIPQAKLTIKGSYAITHQAAEMWSSDIQLIFVKSLGAVAPTGASSEWQVIFGSKQKKMGYEVIVHGDQVVSQKQIESRFIGYALPTKWYDSDGAIASLIAIPQFAKATISGLSFYYNTDAKAWQYGIATSQGFTSMYVK